MRHKFLILIFLTISYLTFSQNLTITYKIGGHQFGEKGEYEREEIIKIYPEKQNFTMSFIQLKKYWIYNDSTKQNNLSKTDTLKLTTRDIRKNKVENLISELNIHRDNFNYNFIKQNIKPSISKKEIIRIAYKKDLFHLIGDEETGKSDEFQREKIREMKRLKNFEEYIAYLKSKLDLNMILIDTWNFAIIENGDRQYKLDFNNDLGQPINNSTKPFTNLDVNVKLKDILPNNSLLKKQIRFESLFEDYIVWYLKK